MPVARVIFRFDLTQKWRKLSIIELGSSKFILSITLPIIYSGLSVQYLMGRVCFPNESFYKCARR